MLRYGAPCYFVLWFAMVCCACRHPSILVCLYFICPCSLSLISCFAWPLSNCCFNGAGCWCDCVLLPVRIISSLVSYLCCGTLAFYGDLKIALRRGPRTPAKAGRGGGMGFRAGPLGHVRYYCIVTILYCNVVSYCIVLYCSVPYYTIPYCFVLYCTIPYCFALYSTPLVLYCAALLGRSGHLAGTRYLLTKDLVGTPPTPSPLAGGESLAFSLVADTLSAACPQCFVFFRL